ncbi:hypothetical protein E0485_05550 [Paenibacillus albiflavus]|uniref:Uncharacterized protein n=1 Tax=Paenibacillus albiflavus TaxID=2545760 RepID=A0A4R4EHK4_9BACL|nr:hypothetical protein [Paenibacillus albiflavus]TCZ79329.1 hypothetical protein E0485_05550 [Paenibacillus albiflavus]
MNKKYEIKIPVSMYIQLVGSIIITLLMLRLVIQTSDYTSVLFILIVFCILLQVVTMFVLMTRILSGNSDLEITKNSIKLNHIEVRIQEIEKIIIQGYFIQSIGIKQFGKRLVSNKLHFRFRNNEEVNINEIKQWANKHGIEVTNKKIYRWI